MLREQSNKSITIHLGKGVSLCAIKNGLSIDTCMGMTPLEGASHGEALR